jgi:hypothetical protein
MKAFLKSGGLFVLRRALPTLILMNALPGGDSFKMAIEVCFHLDLNHS